MNKFKPPSPQLQAAAARVRTEVGKMTREAIESSARSRTPAGRLYAHLSGGKSTADQAREYRSPLGGTAAKP